MVNGRKIKDLMMEKGIQGNEMARTVGVSETMMSYILRGLREPNVAILARIARTLDVTVDELIVIENIRNDTSSSREEGR